MLANEDLVSQKFSCLRTCACTISVLHCTHILTMPFVYSVIKRAHDKHDKVIRARMRLYRTRCKDQNSSLCSATIAMPFRVLFVPPGPRPKRRRWSRQLGSSPHKRPSRKHVIVWTLLYDYFTEMLFERNSGNPRPNRRYSINTRIGDSVSVGQHLIVIESMPW